MKGFNVTNTEFVDGEVYVDIMQQVVNKVNDCFVNLGPGLAEKIPLQSVQPREYLTGDYLKKKKKKKIIS